MNNNTMEKNIFEKIRDGESPAEIVFKNQYVTAFQDIKPNAPVHILLIPNKTITSLSELEDEDGIYISHIFIAAKQIAKEYNIHETGYRVITNCGKYGGQEVPYLHFHLVGSIPLGCMISLPKSSKKIFKEFQIHQLMNKPIEINTSDALIYKDFLKEKQIYELKVPRHENQVVVRRNVFSILEKNKEVDIVTVNQSININDNNFDYNKNIFTPFCNLWCHPDAITNMQFDKKNHDVKITYLINNHEYELNEIDTLLYVCTGGMGFLQLKLYFNKSIPPNIDIDFHYTSHYLSEQNRRYLATNNTIFTEKTSYMYSQFDLIENQSNIDTTYKTWYTQDSTQAFLTNLLTNNQKEK